MRFASPLIKGILIKRYKRFLADVSLEDGSQVTAHCPNTGSMKTCWNVGDRVYLSHNPSPSRKLHYTWELVEHPQGFIGVNTMRPNQIVKEAFLAKRVPGFVSYSLVESEVKHGTSRFDLRLTDPLTEKKFWIEVKNVSLLDRDRLLFPDAVSERGLKHLRHLAELVKRGDRAGMFFLVNRPDGVVFSTADEIHPEYGAAFREVIKQGVEVFCFRVNASLTELTLGASLPIALASTAN